MADVVGVNIRKIRQSRQLLQKELADRADIDPSNLSKLERGEYTWTKENLEKIASALDVTPAAFFGDNAKVPLMGYVEAYAAGKPGGGDQAVTLQVINAKLDLILLALKSSPLTLVG